MVDALIQNKLGNLVSHGVHDHLFQTVHSTNQQAIALATQYAIATVGEIGLFAAVCGIGRIGNCCQSHRLNAVTVQDTLTHVFYVATHHKVLDTSLGKCKGSDFLDGFAVDIGRHYQGSVICAAVGKTGQSDPLRLGIGEASLGGVLCHDKADSVTQRDVCSHRQGCIATVGKIFVEVAVFGYVNHQIATAVADSTLGHRERIACHLTHRLVVSHVATVHESVSTLRVGRIDTSVALFGSVVYTLCIRIVDGLYATKDAGSRSQLFCGEFQITVEEYRGQMRCAGKGTFANRTYGVGNIDGDQTAVLKGTCVNADGTLGQHVGAIGGSRYQTCGIDLENDVTGVDTILDFARIQHTVVHIGEGGVAAADVDDGQIDSAGEHTLTQLDQAGTNLGCLQTSVASKRIVTHRQDTVRNQHAGQGTVCKGRVTDGSYVDTELYAAHTPAYGQRTSAQYGQHFILDTHGQMIHGSHVSDGAVLVLLGGGADDTVIHAQTATNQVDFVAVHYQIGGVATYGAELVLLGATVGQYHRSGANTRGIEDDLGILLHANQTVTTGKRIVANGHDGRRQADIGQVLTIHEASGSNLGYAVADDDTLQRTTLEGALADGGNAFHHIGRHLFQRGACECIVADSGDGTQCDHLATHVCTLQQTVGDLRNGSRQGDTQQTGMGKRTLANHHHLVGNHHALEVDTVAECIVTNGGHAVGQYDIGQGHTVCKRTLADGEQQVGQICQGQQTAVTKRSLANRLQTVDQRHLDQRLVAVEGTCRNSRHGRLGIDIVGRNSASTLKGTFANALQVAAQIQGGDVLPVVAVEGVRTNFGDTGRHSQHAGRVANCRGQYRKQYVALGQSVIDVLTCHRHRRHGRQAVATCRRHTAKVLDTGSTCKRTLGNEDRLVGQRVGGCGGGSQHLIDILVGVDNVVCLEVGDHTQAIVALLYYLEHKVGSNATEGDFAFAFLDDQIAKCTYEYVVADMGQILGQIHVLQASVVRKCTVAQRSHTVAVQIARHDDFYQLLTLVGQAHDLGLQTVDHTILKVVCTAILYQVCANRSCKDSERSSGFLALCGQIGDVHTLGCVEGHLATGCGHKGIDRQAQICVQIDCQRLAGHLEGLRSYGTYRGRNDDLRQSRTCKALVTNATHAARQNKLLQTAPRATFRLNLNQTGTVDIGRQQQAVVQHGHVAISGHHGLVVVEFDDINIGGIIHLNQGDGTSVAHLLATKGSLCVEGVDHQVVVATLEHVLAQATCRGHAKYVHLGQSGVVGKGSVVQIATGTQEDHTAEGSQFCKGVTANVGDGCRNDQGLDRINTVEHSRINARHGQTVDFRRNNHGCHCLGGIDTHDRDLVGNQIVALGIQLLHGKGITGYERTESQTVATCVGLYQAALQAVHGEFGGIVTHEDLLTQFFGFTGEDDGRQRRHILEHTACNLTERGGQNHLGYGTLTATGSLVVTSTEGTCADFAHTLGDHNGANRTAFATNTVVGVQHAAVLRQNHLAVCRHGEGLVISSNDHVQTTGSGNHVTLHHVYTVTEGVACNLCHVFANLYALQAVATCKQVTAQRQYAIAKADEIEALGVFERMVAHTHDIAFQTNALHLGRSKAVCSHFYHGIADTADICIVG